MTKISSDFQDGDVFLFTYDEGAESSKSMVDVIQKLDSVAIRFICEECAITSDALYAMDEDTVYDVVYETIDFKALGVGADSTRGFCGFQYVHTNYSLSFSDSDCNNDEISWIRS